eukprot:992384_1
MCGSNTTSRTIVLTLCVWLAGAAYSPSAEITKDNYILGDANHKCTRTENLRLFRNLQASSSVRDPLVWSAISGLKIQVPGSGKSSPSVKLGGDGHGEIVQRLKFDIPAPFENRGLLRHSLTNERITVSFDDAEPILINQHRGYIFHVTYPQQSQGHHTIIGISARDHEKGLFGLPRNIQTLRIDFVSENNSAKYIGCLETLFGYNVAGATLKLMRSTDNRPQESIWSGIYRAGSFRYDKENYSSSISYGECLIE